MPFHQLPHSLLMVPGPVEVDDQVLLANAHPSMSHVSPDFVPVLGDCIRMTRTLFLARDAQPFLIGGSGTLGWDQVAANVVEPGDHALVLHSGYFADSFAECLQAYGASVTQLRAPIGAAVAPAAVEAAFAAAPPHSIKLVTVSHVDTSTGVLTDIATLAALVRRVSPDTLFVVDAVCSAASEPIRFDAWDLDVVLTASQKGIGAPPGLSILLASQRALAVFRARTAPIAAYYVSWRKWLPIMQAYEAGRPAYFATPPVNLIYALHAALSQILADGTPGLERRFQQHRDAARAIRRAATDIGIASVVKDEREAANGMSALYFPENLCAGDLLPRLASRGVIVAGGLHQEIRDLYFRIGHMGVTVADESRGDIPRVIKALTHAVAEARASVASTNVDV